MDRFWNYLKGIRYGFGLDFTLQKTLKRVFYPTLKRHIPCADSFLQPWKICPRKMHALWQMIVCTHGCRDRSRLGDQWVGRMQEGCLLSHPSICLSLWSLQRKRRCQLRNLCGNTATWKWCHYSLKVHSSPIPTSYSSAFIHVAQPLGSLWFPPPTVALL